LSFNSGIIINFNGHTVTWDTDTIPIKDRDTCTSSSVEALIEVYLSAKEPQMLSLDDVIKRCENLHVEEQHQLKILLQKYEHLFDEALREFNIDPVKISFQLMEPNYKPVEIVQCHASM
jgi:hypothetical protein